jgi:hypothetical protein
MATTADYLNELIEQKNDLAIRLIEKGVEASTSETLETLIPKVSDIESGGGEVNQDALYNMVLGGVE